MTSPAYLKLSVTFATLAVLLAAPVALDAAIIDSEDFDGYTSFPDTPGDPSNAGVPLQAEGADSPNWLAARIEAALDATTVDSDVAVQSKGFPSTLGGPGPFNETPSGRTRDNAALVMRLDLSNYENVVLDFDWRKHAAEGEDRFIVSYHQGDGLGLPNGAYDWFNDPTKGNGSNARYQSNFTEIFNGGGPSGPFQHVTKPLPGGDVLYLAFWLDYVWRVAGDHNAEFGKIDNIVITGDLIPEPATGLILVLGISMLSSLRLRRAS
jgi:hypothetical protein